jgi:hypothetical protein
MRRLKMENINNVRTLNIIKKGDCAPHKEDNPVEIISDREAENLLHKAKRVLHEMESTWEIDHGAAELREKYHLLRYYLDRLRG